MVVPLVRVQLRIGATPFVIFLPGAIPEWLGELGGLQKLNLRQNKFVGEHWAFSTV